MHLIFENDDFAVVYKNENIGFHNELENDETHNGFFSLIKSEFKTLIFPVHRLDKITSGILLVAKSSTIASELSRQFETGKIEKIYFAITTGQPKLKSGTITGDLIKSRDSKWMLSRSTDSPSITIFNSIKIQGKYRFFIIRPITGKTHQIRVALKSNRTPVYGDELYNNSILTGQTPDRAYLHCYSIRFTLSDKNYYFNCEPRSGILFSNLLSVHRDIINEKIKKLSDVSI